MVSGRNATKTMLTPHARPLTNEIKPKSHWHKPIIFVTKNPKNIEEREKKKSNLKTLTYNYMLLLPSRKDVDAASKPF
ncbi:MAG: hypothetical protein CMQ02_00115 [Gammaproteobacteria bacterium]|nr:hypothetical protein [Gammaproteobacteria bacterium]|tara:strand:+ start:425 stop:658 length:234 start_codon:yes stop_codon:yes gene_type:complete